VLAFLCVVIFSCKRRKDLLLATSISVCSRAIGWRHPITLEQASRLTRAAEETKEQAP
jgi:hypothetical protein